MKKGWAITWISKSTKDKQRHLLWENGMPIFFDTKKLAIEYIKKRYSYIATRKDLRADPHMWRMPKPVKAILKVEEVKP